MSHIPPRESPGTVYRLPASVTPVVLVLLSPPFLGTVDRRLAAQVIRVRVGRVPGWFTSFRGVVPADAASWIAGGASGFSVVK